MQEIENLHDPMRMRMRIASATRELLQETELDGISVQKICTKAGIARTTFYTYFHDKFEIATWHFDLIASTYLYETGRTLTWAEAHERNSTELARLKDFYIPVFRTKGYESLFAYANRRRRETLIQTIVEYKQVDLSEELEFQIDALIPAETRAVRKWVLDGMPYSAHHLAELLDTIIPRRLYKLLNTPAAQPRSLFGFDD